jgi:hypothetical protein
MGYELEFEDTFEAEQLDRGRWLPYYLPHWSSRERSAARYEVGGGTLRLLIEADQEPWCPEFDGQVRVSRRCRRVFSRPTIPIDARDFHVYAAEWRPEEVTFFVDGEVVKTVHQSPGYPMQLMLGIYEFPPEEGAEPTRPYPKEFVVDYVRGYRLASEPER